MQRQPPHSVSASAAPTTHDRLRVWRADRCVQSNSAGLYLQWIRRFRAYCAHRKLDERAELTLAGAGRFVTWYARHRHLNPRRLGSARTALYALTRVYQVMGLSLPAWRAPRHARPPATALLRAYADHLVRRRGNPEKTANKRLDHIARFLEYLAGHGKTWRAATLIDIDQFALDRSRHRRQHPFLYPLSACYRAHLGRPGRVRDCPGADPARAPSPCVAVGGRAAPAAISAYVRIATQSLRDVSLPVPT
jgi:hypothetical protein